MKTIILLAIRLYWRFWPSDMRRRCIYRESCSRFVYRTTENSGALHGLRALAQRCRSCRPGYQIFAIGQDIHVRLVDGTVIQASEAADSTIDPFSHAANELLERIERRFELHDG